MLITAKRISVTEAVRTFAEIVNRVYYRRENLVLTKGNKDVVLLQPVQINKNFSCGDLKNLLTASPSLSPKELKAFERDLKKARKTLKLQSNPWDS